MRIVCAVLLLVATAAAQLAITDVTVIPMNREVVLQHQDVVVADGKIIAVGSVHSIKVPKAAQRIDGRGKYLIPGLTDAHVHLLSTTELPLYVAEGVTTVFNLDGRSAHLLWKKQVAEGKLLGPSIFTTGPIFFGAKTKEDAVKAVDDAAAAGYDGFKIYNPVSRDVYPAVADEVHKKNLFFIGHIARGPDTGMTLNSGQSIAHMEEFTYTFFNPKHDGDDHNIVYDESKIPELTKMVKISGVYVVPTIDTYRDIVHQATDINDFLKTPALKYLSPWTLAGLQPDVNRYATGFKPADYDRIRTSLQFQRKLIKAFEDAGVPLMTGTDSTNLGPVSGFSIHEELHEFVASGITPFQALQAATVTPATYLRRADQFGTVEVGKHADLVLLNADPLANIDNTRNIAGVIAHGEWLDSAKIQSILAALQAQYARDLAEVTHDLQDDPEAAATYIRDKDPFSRVTSEAVVQICSKKSAAEVMSFFDYLRAKDPKSPIFAEPSVNQLGYLFLGRGDTSKSIGVFRWNTERYPTSGNTYDSLGEAYAKVGDMMNALASYSKALQVEPNYPNAEFAKRFVEEHARGK